MSKPKFDYILVDGRHMLYRAVFRLARLNAELPDGTKMTTGGVWGFINSVTRVWQHWADPAKTKVVICWEGGYDHRTALHPEYKQNRKKERTKDEHIEAYFETLPQQERVLKHLLCWCGWSQAWSDGYEADDVMGALARKLGKLGTVAIYTRDQDLFQEINDTVKVVSPPASRADDSEDIIMDEEAVWHKLHVWPDQIVDFKALAGDSGDNIPGVAGIGAGWAAKLLYDYGDLDGVLEAARDAPKGKMSGTDWNDKNWNTQAMVLKLRDKDNIKAARMSQKLATIVDCPVKLLESKGGWKDAMAAFKRYKMKSLLQPNTLAVIKEIGTDGSIDATLL